MVDLILHSTLQHSLLFVVPTVCALMLRAARTPGWAVLGGILAGILLGPTLFGRVAPRSHEYIFIGGVAAREQMEQTLHDLDIKISAARAMGVDPDDDLAIRASMEVELTGNLAESRWREQRPMRSYTTLLISLTLLAGGLLAVPRTDTPPASVSVFSIGLWSAAVPGGLAWAAMHWLWDYSFHQSLVVAATVAVGPWVIMGIDRKAAEQAELGGARLVQAAGRAASLISVVVLFYALHHVRGTNTAGWSLSLLSMPLGWIALRNVALSDRMRIHLRFWFDLLLVAPLACAASIRIELFEHFSFWPLVVLLLLSGDGRWIGALLGALSLGGRRALRTMRLVLGSIACGPTQLAMCAILVHTWAVPDELQLAIVAGAAMVEITAPIRRKVAADLEHAEQELDDSASR